MEGSDLKIQQEINELTDKFRELTNDMNQFKAWVSNELKQEFQKINSNFMSSQGVVDAKEQRLQGEVEHLKQ